MINSFENVTTYINSGNILLIPLKKYCLACRDVQKGYRKETWIPCGCAVIPVSELLDALKYAPKWQSDVGDAKYNAFFVIAPMLNVAGASDDVRASLFVGAKQVYAS